MSPPSKLSNLLNVLWNLYWTIVMLGKFYFVQLLPSNSLVCFKKNPNVWSQVQCWLSSVQSALRSKEISMSCYSTFKQPLCLILFPLFIAQALRKVLYTCTSPIAPEVTDCLWSALDTQRLLNVINVIIPCKSIALLSAYKTNYDTLIKVFCSKCTSISKKMMTLISENINFMSKSSDV